jgi:hypothetical protein
MTTFRVVTAALLLLASLTANAQLEPIPSPHKRTSVDGLKHHVYEKTSLLPDALALEVILTVTAGATTRDDKEISLAEIKERMGMSEGHARGFLQYLIKIKREYEKDLARLQARIGCSTERPYKSGDAVYSLFESMYAGKRALLAQYLAIIASDLTEEEYAQLQNWLEHTKLQTTYFTAHHKEAYEAEGVSPDQQLTNICTHLMTVTP